MTIEPSATASTAPLSGGGQCARHPERAAALRCSRCGDNLCEGCAAERIDGVCKSCIELLSSRGKVAHVEWLAIVTMVHGGLLTMYALLLALYGVVFGATLGQVEPTRADAPPPQVMAGLIGGTMLVMMLGQLVPGVLQLVAGWYMRKFRYRALAVGALLSGVLSAIGCYCLPTAALLIVWGLIVLFDDSVAKRFEAATAAADRDAVS